MSDDQNNQVNPGEPENSGQAPTPPPPPPIGPTPQAPGQAASGPQNPPPVGGYVAPPPAVPATNQNAVIALVLAILSWVLCPILFAIIALVLASNADKEIRASNGWSTGSGYVTAARVIAWVNIALSILAFVFFFVMAAFVATNPDLQDILITPTPWDSPSTLNG